MRHVALETRLRVLLFFASSTMMLLPGATAEASSTLELRMDRLAGRVEKTITRRADVRPRGLLSLDSDLPESSLAIAVLEKLKSSSVIHFEDRSTADELITQLREAARVAAMQPPLEQDRRFRGIRERLQGIGYDFWVFLSDKSDQEFVRIGAHVVHGERGCQGKRAMAEECFSTRDYFEEKVRRSIVDAEQFAVGVAVGGVQRTIEQTTFGVGSGGVLGRFPNKAEVEQTVVVAFGEAPRFRFEGALLQGDSLTAANNPDLTGEQKELSLGLEGLLFSAGRVALLAGGAFQGIGEAVVDERRVFSSEASAEFTALEATLGLAYGNLLNGVTLRGFGLRSKAEDTSPETEFFGQPSDMWDDEGYGAELRARLTTRKWEVDFRARRFITTRTFDQSYFPNLTEAEIEGMGFRVAATRYWRAFGIGLVGSHAETQFADSPTAVPEARVSSDQADTFIGATMRLRWHPN